ncbi:MAG: glycosyltransferase family 4 protein [Candidatus Zambryskibacteria bacterium]|nr:glycosyltransferase family 4 protein [Candidatus Zambryskibacteria bacterium]
MKILILTPNLNAKSGWGRYSLDLLSALSRNGIQCVIITTDKLSSPGNYKKNYFFAFWYAWKLRKYAQECDFIHSFVEPYSFVAYLLSKLTGKKYLISAHGTYALMPYEFPAYKKFFHDKSFRGATKIFCGSNFTKELLAKRGLNNLCVINYGLDFNKFYDSHLPLYEERENNILTVGALKYRKGYHISLRAFAVACDIYPDLTYSIVGDQSDVAYFNSLKKLVKELSIENAVSFFDSISDAKLIQLYRKAKLFILTPISEDAHFEGFGLVYLEAGACGLPVVGSLGSGAEDAIKDGETGFLISPKNSKETSQAIIRILGDQSLAKTLANNGIAWAKEHDWAIVVTRYLAIYNML